MTFACIYVPDFQVQSITRAEPALRNAGVALIDGSPPLWNVVAANPAALQAGIQLGMTKSQAEDFCAVQIRQRSESREKAAHAALLDASWSICPRVEDTAPDTIVLDLEGLAHLFGTAENLARELAKRVSRIGIVACVAVASQIEVSILAARGFPGITMIPVGEELARLGGLPVRVLVANAEVLETLARWGIDTLRALATLPLLQLSERLGQEGVRLHELARGVYHRALVLAEPNLSFEEEIELDDSVEELEPLSFVLGRLLDQLCARLEARALAAHVIYIRFELEPSFEKDIQSLKDDSRKKAGAKIYTKALTLPVPLRDSKTLLKLLRLLLQAYPPKSPIQKIILAVDPAAPRVIQSGLFVPRGPDPEKLELTVARLAKLVGDTNVGSPELLDTHRPESFRMSRFHSPTGRAGATMKLQPTAPGSLCGFRVARPALPVNVELRESQPARIFLLGRCGHVLATSGPWRDSGNWWSEDAWAQDEWDLAVDFDSDCDSPGPRAQNSTSWPQYGVYRIFYDTLCKGWFVRGFYD
jgi:protein ImuB